MGQGELDFFFAAEPGPEQGGQGGMEAEEGRADAGKALRFDQGGGFELAA